MNFIVDNSIELHIIKHKKYLFINDQRVKTSDTITYRCSVCGATNTQRFGRRKRFLDKNFICPACEVERNSIEKYGIKHPQSSIKAKEKRRQTNLEKYGVENPYQVKEVKEKIKQTNLKIYGVENPSQSKEIRNKISYDTKKASRKRIQTNLEKYGVDNVAKLDESIVKSKSTKYKKYGDGNFVNPKKAKQTSLERYGVDNPAKHKNIKEKTKQTNLEKYGVNYPTQLNNIIKKRVRSRLVYTYNSFLQSNRLKDRVVPLFDLNEYVGIENKYLWGCKECGTKFEDHLDDGRIPRCPTCYPILSGYSTQEKEIVEWLKSLNYGIKENDKSILNGKELDIYLPDYNLAIEYNGAYWHSNKYRDKYYHQNKVKLCHQQGIRLLHIWEDDWINNPEEVKEKILYYINNLDEKIKPRKPILEKIMGFEVWK